MVFIYCWSISKCCWVSQREHLALCSPYLWLASWRHKSLIHCAWAKGSISVVFKPSPWVSSGLWNYVIQHMGLPKGLEIWQDREQWQLTLTPLPHCQISKCCRPDDLALCMGSFWYAQDQGWGWGNGPHLVLVSPGQGDPIQQLALQIGPQLCILQIGPGDWIQPTDLPHTTPLAWRAKSLGTTDLYQSNLQISMHNWIVC